MRVFRHPEEEKGEPASVPSGEIVLVAEAEGEAECDDNDSAIDGRLDHRLEPLLRCSVEVDIAVGSLY